MTALSQAPTLFPSIGRRPAPSLTSWLLVGSLTLSAGIHLAVAYQHGVAGDHGRFFAAVGLAQAVLAMVVSRSISRRWLWAAMALSVFLVGTWVVAKTSLLPGITGLSTPAGLVDTAAVVLEGMAVAAALVLLRRHRPPSPVRTNVAADDHHAGPTGHEPAASAHLHEPGAPAHPH